MCINKKRIAILDTSVAPTGAFNSALVLYDSLKLQYPIVIFVPNDSVILEQEHSCYSFGSYSYPRVKKNLKSVLTYLPMSLYAAYKLSKQLKGYDLVILNDFNNLTGYLLKIFRPSMKIITFFRLITSKAPRLLTLVYLSLCRLFSNRNVAISKSVAKELTSLKNLRLIYNSLPCDINHSISFFSKKDNSQLKMVYIGNYMPGKGQKEALEAFLQIKNTNATLSFYGGDMGLRKNKDFKDSLVKLAGDKLDRTVFFNGFMEKPYVELLGYNVLLNFSRSESFSRTCLEGSFSKLAVIATKCGGPEEIVEDKVTGLLVDVGDITKMKESMQIFIDDPDLAKQYGINGNSRVNKLFSYSVFSENVHKLILSLH
ncbi:MULTISPECIES: glycosyltransferase family 4 protein [unclassified Vibrio]|uniref:glycosyltransferase family 4 protein n=1 Tax=unclassified Vibrio TaxID=2614977 RepID=UPI00354BB059